MITMTIEEVLKSAIDQIEHMQDMITELEEDMLTNSHPSPRLKSTIDTINMLEDAIKSPASQQVVLVNESNVNR